MKTKGEKGLHSFTQQISNEDLQYRYEAQYS